MSIQEIKPNPDTKLAFSPGLLASIKSYLVRPLIRQSQIEISIS